MMEPPFKRCGGRNFPPHRLLTGHLVIGGVGGGGVGGGGEALLPTSLVGGGPATRVAATPSHMAPAWYPVPGCARLKLMGKVMDDELRTNTCLLL